MSQTTVVVNARTSSKFHKDRANNYGMCTYAVTIAVTVPSPYDTILGQINLRLLTVIASRDSIVVEPIFFLTRLSYRMLTNIASC